MPPTALSRIFYSEILILHKDKPLTYFCIGLCIFQCWFSVFYLKSPKSQISPAQCTGLCSKAAKQRHSESLEASGDTLSSVLSYAKISCSATTELDKHCLKMAEKGQ